MTRERTAIDILEEAVNLLRAAPLRATVAYLTGAVPFILALLFFLNDMTRSPFAFEHLGRASLALAALYIWKNVWQALFARQLYESLSPQDARIPVMRLIAIQAALQPVGLAADAPVSLAGRVFSQRRVVRRARRSRFHGRGAPPSRLMDASELGRARADHRWPPC